MSTHWYRLIGNWGLFGEAVRRDRDMVFHSVGPLAEDCEAFVRENWKGEPSRVEDAFGSREAFAEAVFRERLHALGEYLQMTILATLTAVGIPPMLWLGLHGISGGALDLAWQIPFCIAVSVAVSAFLALMATFVIGFPAFLLSRGYLYAAGRPEMAYAWQRLFLG